MRRCSTAVRDGAIASFGQPGRHRDAKNAMRIEVNGIQGTSPWTSSR